jgi:hypothetical protein
MNPYIDLDTIIERTFIMLAQHPEIRQPVIKNSAGATFKITRFRDHDGFDDNQSGATLSIFPYSYGTTTTTQSGNAGIVYEPYHVGSGTAEPAFDRARVHLMVKISYLGQNRSTATENHDGFAIQVVRNETERLLRKWAEKLRQILLTKPMSNVSGLVRNSNVNYIGYPTTEWTGKQGENAVLHSTYFVWQLELNAPRNWKTWPIYNPLDGVNTWDYVGVELRTGTLIYFDSSIDKLVSVDGFNIASTPAPANIPVKWNPVAKRFENAKTSVPLTDLELTDPATSKPWIATYLKIVGVIKAAGSFNKLQQNLFWNTTTLRLELADGTIVTALPGEDGVLGNGDDIGISYDPDSGILSVTYPGQSSRPVNTITDPVYLLNTSNVNIYDANGMVLRESFKL